MRTILLCITALSLSSWATAQTATPPAGSYGFDWLHPKTSKCVPISAKLRKQFKSCKYEEKASFDGETSLYKCTVSQRVEYMLYSTKAICEQQFGYMQANGG